MTNLHPSLPAPTPDEEAYTPQTLREELLGSQTYQRVPLLVDFCQRHGGDRAPGPLRLFVRHRRLFALQLYLLHACLARRDPRTKEMAASSWALLLDNDGGGAESKVSRNWAWLQGHRLIETTTRGRNLIVLRRSESGDGTDASSPTREDRFFYLPFEYFLNEWHRKLSLPATAALLIALSKSTARNWFELPLVQAPTWYGISTDTLQRGLDGLRDANLLKINARRKRNYRARGGSVRVNEYALLGPFMTRIEGAA